MSTSKPTIRRRMTGFVATIFMIACIIVVLYMVLGHPGVPGPTL